MKAGFTVSAAAHCIILAILLVSFSAPPPMDNQQTEDVPITLVPLSDEMTLKQGEADAQQRQKPALKATKKQNTPKPDAKNAGEADIDTKMPLKPKEKPREVQALPPPKGEQQGRTEPKTEPAAPTPEQPKEQAAAAEPAPPKPAPALPAPKPAEVKPAEPKPAPQEAAVDAPSDDIGDFLKADATAPVKPQEKTPQQPAPEKPQRKPETEAKPQAPELPQTAPLPTARPQEKPAAAKGEKDGATAADSQNALIDRTRTQGGGAKRSKDEAALGARKNIGSGENLQQTLDNLIGRCVARNWDIGVIQGSSAYDLRVQMRFKLNQDGSLAGEPELTPSGGDVKDRDVIASQARAALMKCAPFKDLPADKYAQWHDVTMNMRAFPDD